MLKLKPISVVFISAQLLDVITTAIAMSLGFTELNYIVGRYGWLPIIVLKTLVIVGTTIFFEKIEIKKGYWLIPISTWFAPLWNIYQLIVYWVWVQGGSL